MEMSEATAPRGTVTVICTQSCKEALIALVPVFERAKGFALDVTYGGGPNLAKQISGGLSADIFVGPEEFSGPLIKEGRLDGNTRTAFAHSSAAFAVKAGTPKPDISSPQTLKEALLAAKAVCYSGGASGIHFVQACETLGIADVVAATLDACDGGPARDLDDLVAADAEARRHAQGALAPA
jgi:molybdate transport system substrate-binding protein